MDYHKNNTEFLQNNAMWIKNQYLRIVLTLSVVNNSTNWLKRDMRKSTRAAFAEGTQRNLRTQWKTILLF
jgi:hypothetical protein